MIFGFLRDRIHRGCVNLGWSDRGLLVGLPVRCWEVGFSFSVVAGGVIIFSFEASVLTVTQLTAVGAFLLGFGARGAVVAVGRGIPWSGAGVAPSAVGVPC